jgi:hypothetical protein
MSVRIVRPISNEKLNVKLSTYNATGRVPAKYYNNIMHASTELNLDIIHAVYIDCVRRNDLALV